ncbi:UDP-N-acetylmuramoyl-tripeptide--D-alanyl-D-alanine ligase [Planctomicrobium sp. SH664]|uniref:UDP-N-acetylmuramoyl-tripeptide--D-alanyl-D- alanine ligase n=1 Tax=Planctomicrobium sp. SH664 TaxID=3448125 RepID=UPI003F5C1DB1
MQPISFHELIAATGGIPVGIDRLDETVGRVEIDSRRVRPGDLFFAMTGKKQDGHKYVKAAFSAGAVAAVVDAAKANKVQGPRIEVENTLEALWKLSNWYRRQFETLVIGITGSVGKTTTRRMIASVLSGRFPGSESPHNYNNEFGVPLSLLQIEPQHEFAVIEMGASKTGDIETLAAIAQPEVGALTAIAPAHLDEFGSLDNIVRTKAELIEALPESGFAVLNGDDKHLVQMSLKAACPVILVGEREHNHLRATDVVARNESLEFNVGSTRFVVPVSGRQNLTAALIAIAIGRQIDLNDLQIAEGLQTFTPAPGRSQLLRIGSWTVIDDTYNASPASMSAACQTLKGWQTTGKRIFVAGDMLTLGDWTQDFHRLLGEELYRSKFDRMIAVGSQAAVVAGSARKLGMDAGCLGACRDHDLALMLLDCWLEPGDVVLVKGSRDMKMEAVVTGLHRLSEQRLQSDSAERRAA